MTEKPGMGLGVRWMRLYQAWDTWQYKNDTLKLMLWKSAYQDRWQCEITGIHRAESEDANSAVRVAIENMIEELQHMLKKPCTPSDFEV